MMMPKKTPILAILCHPRHYGASDTIPKPIKANSAAAASMTTENTMANTSSIDGRNGLPPAKCHFALSMSRRVTPNPSRASNSTPLASNRSQTGIIPVSFSRLRNQKGTNCGGQALCRAATIGGWLTG